MGWRLVSAPDARAYFLLLRQKKVAKEKATQATRSAAPTPLRYSKLAGAAELGPAGLKQSSPLFRRLLRCSALHMGPKSVSA